jgi:hypothetical protein
VFDLRYHVASLAAVFFALVIGILVGVALASHGLGNSERLRYQRDVRNAQAEINRLNQQVTTLADDNRAGKRFLDNAYKGVMADRLRGKKIAVLFIGSVDPGLRSAVTTALGDAGGALLRLRAITAPISGSAIAGVLRRRPQLATFAAPGHLDDVGRELADEFAVGGDTPLWNALEQKLVEERSGAGKHAADGVVVVRTVGLQNDGTSALLHGLLAELSAMPLPVVAVEATRSRPSWVRQYRQLGLSSVDNVDKPAGRVSLAIVLSGGAVGTGHYGTRPGDDDVVAQVPALPSATTTGG